MKKILEKLNQLPVGSNGAEVQKKLQELDPKSFSEKEKLVFGILNRTFEYAKRFNLVYIGKPEDFEPTKGLEAEDILVEGVAEKANLSVNIIENKGNPYLSIQSDEGLSWIIEVLPQEIIKVIILGFNGECSCDDCNS